MAPCFRGRERAGVRGRGRFRGRPSALQIGDDAFDLAHHVVERFVLIGPQRHRLRVLRRRLQLGEGGGGPAARPENHRDHLRLAAIVPLQRLLDLDAPAVLGGDEAGAHQQQDDVRRGQVPIDLLFPLLADVDVPIVPLGDHPAPAEESQVILQLAPQLLVLMRIRVEEADRLFLMFSASHAFDRPTLPSDRITQPAIAIGNRKA